MKNKQNLSCDLLIIGAGLAGMVAAARACCLGLKTIQVGNSSNFFLTSGLLDFLGVYPIASGRVLSSPAQGFEKLIIDNPGHPYSKTGYKNVQKSLDFLKKYLSSAGLDYKSGIDENFSVLTSAGTFKPSFMIPKTFFKGSVINQETKKLLPKKRLPENRLPKKLLPSKLLIVDFKGFREFSAKQIVNVLRNKYPHALALTIEIPDVSGGLNPMRLANLFEEDQFLKQLANKIKPFAKKADLVGLPAVCGLNNSLGTIKKLEQLSGLDCFEIPGMPPSIPGLRLKKAFEKQLSQKNHTFLNNAKIRSHKFTNNHFVLDAATQNTNSLITAKGVILASGRFPGGGLHAQRKRITETIFNLSVCQPEKRSQWYHLNLFNPNGHCINKAGVETDDVFKPVDKNKNPVFKNLYAVGSILAHNDWVRLKSGSGVSCVSAYTAVNDFYDSKFKGGSNV